MKMMEKNITQIENAHPEKYVTFGLQNQKMHMSAANPFP